MSGSLFVFSPPLLEIKGGRLCPVEEVVRRARRHAEGRTRRLWRERVASTREGEAAGRRVALAFIKSRGKRKKDVGVSVQKNFSLLGRSPS